MSDPEFSVTWKENHDGSWSPLINVKADQLGQANDVLTRFVTEDVAAHIAAVTETLTGGAAAPAQGTAAVKQQLPVKKETTVTVGMSTPPPSPFPKQQQSDTSVNVIEKFGGKVKFLEGVPGSPECGHGMPASLSVGVSQAGKKYEAWCCPHKGQASYKQACDLWEFADVDVSAWV